MLLLTLCTSLQCHLFVQQHLLFYDHVLLHQSRCCFNLPVCSHLLSVVVCCVYLQFVRSHVVLVVVLSFVKSCLSSRSVVRETLFSLCSKMNLLLYCCFLKVNCILCRTLPLTESSSLMLFRPFTCSRTG